MPPLCGHQSSFSHFLVTPPYSKRRKHLLLKALDCVLLQERVPAGGDHDRIDHQRGSPCHLLRLLHLLRAICWHQCEQVRCRRMETAGLSDPRVHRGNAMEKERANLHSPSPVTASAFRASATAWTISEVASIPVFTTSVPRSERTWEI